MSDADVETVATLLADECARRILVETRAEPRSAADLCERTGASDPTVYRRLSELEAAGLVEVSVRPVPDGRNYKTYTARLDGVDISLVADGFDVEVRRREPMVDRFTRFVEEM